MPIRLSEGQGILDQAAHFVAQRLVRLAGEVVAGDTNGLSSIARDVFATSVLSLLIESVSVAMVHAPQTPLTQPLYRELVLMKDDLTGLIQASYPDEEAHVLGPKIQAIRARFAPTPRNRG